MTLLAATTAAGVLTGAAPAQHGSGGLHRLNPRPEQPRTTTRMSRPILVWIDGIVIFEPSEPQPVRVIVASHRSGSPEFGN